MLILDWLDVYFRKGSKKRMLLEQRAKGHLKKQTKPNCQFPNHRNSAKTIHGHSAVSYPHLSSINTASPDFAAAYTVHTLCLHPMKSDCLGSLAQKLVLMQGHTPKRGRFRNCDATTLSRLVGSKERDHTLAAKYTTPRLY